MYEEYKLLNELLETFQASNKSVLVFSKVTVPGKEGYHHMSGHVKGEYEDTKNILKDETLNDLMSIADALNIEDAEFQQALKYHISIIATFIAAYKSTH